jgi:hypothetical protein
MRNVSDKKCTNNQKTQYIFKLFFTKLCHSSDNVEEHGRAREAVGEYIMLRRKGAICMPDNSGKNTHTHSSYLILIAS